MKSTKSPKPPEQVQEQDQSPPTAPTASTTAADPTVSPPAAPAAPESQLRLSKLCRSEHGRIDRRLMIPAPYNPRIISATAALGLQHSLQSHGLLGGIVWNRATRHIVAGHQRVDQADKIEGHKAYLIDVEIIDEPDIAKEKALNIALNSPNIQGQYDVESLLTMYKNNEFDPLEASFTRLDFEELAISHGLGADYLDNVFSDEGHDTRADIAEDIDAVTEHANAIKKRNRELERDANFNAGSQIAREGQGDNDPDYDNESDESDESESESDSDDTTGVPAISPDARAAIIESVKAARNTQSEPMQAQKENDFYFTVYGGSNAQKRDFFHKIGVDPLAPSIDLTVLARLLDITLVPLPEPKPKKPAK